MKKFVFLSILLTMFVFASESNAQIKSESEIPCQIIRKVRYPVTKTEPYKQPLRIALLDLCPKTVSARPMISFMIDGKIVDREYDVIKVFKSAKSARNYAKKNKITDVTID